MVDACEAAPRVCRLCALIMTETEEKQVSDDNWVLIICETEIMHGGRFNCEKSLE